MFAFRDEAVPCLLLAFPYVCPLALLQVYSAHPTAATSPSPWQIDLLQEDTALSHRGLSQTEKRIFGYVHDCVHDSMNVWVKLSAGNVSHFGFALCPNPSNSSIR